MAALSWSPLSAAAAACVTGTQDLPGDPIPDPGEDGGTQPNDDDSGGTLADDSGTAAKQKNPDAGSVVTTPDAGSTDAGTVVPDSGSKPDASVADGGCKVVTENLLVNGNLDNGKAPWVLSSAAVLASTADLPVAPQSGGYGAWLGGAPNANDFLYQVVAMPSNATAAHLKGYRWIATADFANIDILSFQTRSAAGTKLEQLGTLSPGSSDSKWVAFDYTLPNVHAGTSIQIAILGTTDSSLNTNMMVDTLDLEVTYCKY